MYDITNSLIATERKNPTLPESKNLTSIENILNDSVSAYIFINVNINTNSQSPTQLQLLIFLFSHIYSSGSFLFYA